MGGYWGHSPGIEPRLWTIEDNDSLRWAVYVSYLLSSSETWGGGVPSELCVLQDSVSSSSVVADSRSGVMNPKFSVLHLSVDAVSAVAGLCGSVPRAKGAGECIATRFRQLSRFCDSLGVMWGGGERGPEGCARWPQYPRCDCASRLL